MEQQPFLIVQPVAGPVPLLQFTEFIVSWLQLPGIQIETDTFQSIEAFESVPAAEDGKAPILRPSALHECLEGDMAECGREIMGCKNH